MKRLASISLASSLALFAWAPSPALGTLDRSSLESTPSAGTARVGRTAQRLLRGAERADRGKRCATCRTTRAISSRAPDGAASAVPEPAGALVFGLGALAIGACATRRRR